MKPSSESISAKGRDAKAQAWAQLTLAYLQELPQQLGEMHQALKQRDYDGVRKLAHRIKGTAGTYRLQQIASKAELLEQIAGSGQQAEIKMSLDQLQHSIEQALEEHAHA